MKVEKKISKHEHADLTEGFEWSAILECKSTDTHIGMHLVS
jgi:hypothetical protein